MQKRALALKEHLSDIGMNATRPRHLEEVEAHRRLTTKASVQSGALRAGALASSLPKRSASSLARRSALPPVGYRTLTHEVRSELGIAKVAELPRSFAAREY